MYIKLNDNEQKILDLLTVIPPDIDGAERFLQANFSNCNSVTKVAIEYAGCCFCEAGDFAYVYGIPHPASIVPNLHSTYILDVVSLLL